MPELGYWLSSEEHAPNELVHFAQRAEQVGFTFALISDHYHPWIDKQGQSPFVWRVIGGIAHATTNLRLGTGVTCPLMRIHPAIVAQAAATAAAMMPGRFFLGVGSGENARIYTLPEQPPPMYVAASGSRAAELAGGIGDGLIAVMPQAEVVQKFDKASEQRKPHIGKLTVCWAESEEEARRTAHAIWPTAGLKGALSTELALPSHFEDAAKLVGEDDVAEQIVCGPDAVKHIEKIHEYAEAGYEQIVVHQVGPDQEGFFRFYEREVLPNFREES